MIPFAALACFGVLGLRRPALVPLRRRPRPRLRCRRHIRVHNRRPANPGRRPRSRRRRRRRQRPLRRPTAAPSGAADGRAKSAKTGGKAPAGGKPAGGGKAAASKNDRRRQTGIGTATVTGDREQPKVMYIVPWKKSDIGDLSGKPMNSLLDEALAPVDRDEFKREVMYYQAVKAMRPKWCIRARDRRSRVRSKS